MTTERDLRQALEGEQISLWHDLDTARRRSRSPQPAMPGAWSIECEDLAERIVEIGRLVGPTNWESVQDTCLDVYAPVYEAAGITPHPVDWAEVAELRKRIAASAL